MMKTNKSYSKRLKRSGTGKLMARKPGQNHFNAKAPRSKQLAGKRKSEFLLKPKAIATFLQK